MPTITVGRYRHATTDDSPHLAAMLEVQNVAYGHLGQLEVTGAEQLAWSRSPKRSAGSSWRVRHGLVSVANAARSPRAPTRSALSS